MASGVVSGDCRSLSRAITLTESTRAADRQAATALLRCVAEARGRTPMTPSFRLGVTGAPGAGKSAFVEMLGLFLARDTPDTAWPLPSRRVAVLTVDPSSPVTGGSILGDMTRMVRLTQQPNAYIRQTPSRGILGGIARRTDEAIWLCEAAGYGVVLVETVGVGQSEAAVASVVDAVLLLYAPGGGDALQGSKKGILEYADVVVVNKADGHRLADARRAATELRDSLSMRLNESGSRSGDVPTPWSVPVLLTSSLELPPANAADDATDGVNASMRSFYTAEPARHRSVLEAPEPVALQRVHDIGARLERPMSAAEIWAVLMNFRRHAGAHLQERRFQQRLRWWWTEVADEVVHRLRADDRLAPLCTQLQDELRHGHLTARAAATRLLDIVWPRALVPDTRHDVPSSAAR